MPVLIGVAIIVTMLTWLRGRSLLGREAAHATASSSWACSQTLERRPPTRVAGAAVFLQTDPLYAPSALMHNLKHNRVLHDILVFISVETKEVPRVAADERVDGEEAAARRFPGRGPLRLHGAAGRARRAAHCASPTACRSIRARLPISSAAASIRTSARSRMPFWQQRLFIMLANQSARAIEFFRIPPERVVELGMQMSV